MSARGIIDIRRNDLRVFGVIILVVMVKVLCDNWGP